ncbi:hypothetical protein Tco_0656301 [Tanacetum coccineum]|uniref:Uncharacterized protein n=1 Tax=Tanacetum coccineum TaxID=301880 RepID=A0ABQ4X8D8_9ASTR
MENANPPPTLNQPALPTALSAKFVQELNELQVISACIPSRLENIEHFPNGFVNPPNKIDMDDLEPDDESVYTPLVSPFLDSDDDSDDGEVLYESGNGGLSNDKHPIYVDIVGDVKDILDGCHKLVETFRMARDDQ